ncbi:MAG: fibrobacter succinogenes major paralogous domain-containing protein [Paludibacter sp.]|nr:fibrobacter succinogenes major paralogous domain-containing protein [Paludibacter sp.]
MKMTSIKSTALICFILLSVGSFTLQAQGLKDKNGNLYRTIKYGLQEWTASNISTTIFNNGDVIPEAKTKEEWIKAGTSGKPAWCYYKNDPENGKKYGKLYNWYAINDPRGLAPAGWKISTNNEWMTLIQNMQGVDYAGPKLKNTKGWKSRNGVNKIGFSALPAGIRDENGDFSFLGTVGQWWSNTEPVEVKKSNMIFSVKLNDNTVEISYVKVKKDTGLSVRLVRAIK